MSIDDPIARQAFVRGARAVLLSVAFHIPLREHKALEAWIDAIDSWQGGDPPAPPEPWLSLVPYFDNFTPEPNWLSATHEPPARIGRY